LESDSRELRVISKHTLIILLSTSVFAGCSYTDMDCQSSQNIKLAEQGFAAYVAGQVSDVEMLKANAPGLQSIGGDRELGRLLENFEVPSLTLAKVGEVGRQGVVARSCSGQLVATFHGVQKTYPVGYDIARSLPLGSPKIEFLGASTLSAAYRLVGDIVMAERRAETLSRYQKLSEKALAAGFVDVSLFERQQAMQQQKILLVGERERISRDLVRLRAQDEKDRAERAVLGEKLAHAETVYKDFKRKLISGRDFSIGTDGLQIEDIQVTYPGAEDKPRLVMQATNTGKKALASASLEVRVFLDGSDQPFLVSGDRFRDGRFTLRFEAPGLQVGSTVEVQAVMTGQAEAWRSPDLSEAKRRQVMVRVLDTLAVNAVKAEQSPFPEPSAELVATQQRLDEVAEVARDLAAKLEVTQAASKRLDTEIERIETDLSALGDAGRSQQWGKGERG
jgi:hypothetical protein